MFYAAFHQGLHCLLSQKRSSEKEIDFFFLIITCDPLIYTMDHSKFIISNQRRKNLLVHKGIIQYGLDGPLYILRGHRKEFLNSFIFLSMKIFVLESSADPDKLPHFVALCLGLHFLPNYYL